MAGVSLPKSQPVRRLAASIAAPVVRNAAPAAVVRGALCACRLSCATNNDCEDLPGLYRDNAVCESLRTKHSWRQRGFRQRYPRHAGRGEQCDEGWGAHPAATR